MVPADRLVGAVTNWSAIPPTILNIPATLCSGQTFLWRPLPDGRWVGPIGDIAVLLDPQRTGFGWSTWPAGCWDAVARYFRLDADLDAMYADWSRRDPSFGCIVDEFRGLRVVQQSFDTAVVSFVCSSCNNVARITRLVQTIAEHFGPPLGAFGPVTLHGEPTLERLERVREADLRAMGLGYRARYLADIAVQIADSGASWSERLSELPYDEARRTLMRLPGVGPKVADCVCLFGLGHDEAVPVDTHMRRYVTEAVAIERQGRSLTPAIYELLAGAFRGIMGPYAGWAQQYAFMWMRTSDRPRLEGKANA